MLGEIDSDTSTESSASLELFARLKLPARGENVYRESLERCQGGLYPTLKDAGLTIGEMIAERAQLPWCINGRVIRGYGMV